MNIWIKNGLSAAAIIAFAAGTGWAIQQFHRPGQLDVISAQAMDMSQMRPPAGAAPVTLADMRRGSLADTVTYTGSIVAYNEQDISPRITGTLVSLPVYPGDRVQAGQLLARLDTAEAGARAEQAAQEARQAQLGVRVAHLTHYLHHQAELDQATAQVAAARLGVSNAEAEAHADQEAVGDAQAGVQNAQAGADYWAAEIVREKQLADAGAVSRQEYQSELSQSQAAHAALAQAQSKVRQAVSAAQAGRAKAAGARRQVDVSQAGIQMAQADIAVAEGQAQQAEAGASAAAAAARAAAVQQGYARITASTGGLVTARPVAPGTLVQPGTIILKIAEIDRVRVQANIAAEDMTGVHVGSPVQITAQGTGSGKAISARVTSVFPAANAQTRTVVVEAVVANPHHDLLPGAFVTMQIAKNSAADKLLVPASAIVSQGGSSYVWLASGGATALAPATTYRCEKCRMVYSAADAKKNNFVDPMDGGRLLPVSSGAASASPPDGLVAQRRLVQTGASDGAWTEIAADVPAGSRVVTNGQAGLSDGAAVVATPWGANGPSDLPSAAAAGLGRTVYRCEKCGMTYSEDDAKKNNYVDPMDGGKLVPVKGQ